jgi:ketosteroid isomerase-like protein
VKKGFPLSYLFATVVLLAGLSQATAQQQATVSVDGTAAVLSVLSGLSAADNAGDLDAVVNHYRGDAILLPPNANVVTGSPAIRAWYEQGLFRHFRCEVSFDADETEASGDWAFARGYINGRLNPKADEPLIKLHEKFIMILRHDHNGWKIARLIWNSDEPAAAAAK